MPPIAKSAIVWVIVIALCITLCFVWKFIPQKIKRGITTSIIFIFTANLLTNMLREFQINNNVGKLVTHESQIIFMLSIAAALSVMAFLIIFLVKNEELQRKIFFSVALTVFVTAYMFWFIRMTQGGGAFPSHLCRQIAYGFPLVYFSKYTRKYTLPFFTLAAMIGGVATIFFNFSLLDIPFINYGMLDQVLIHSIMIILGVIIWKSGEVKHSFHHIWQFFLGMLGCTIFALGQNYVEFLQKGEFGSGMYLKETLVEGLIPTWLFIVLVFVVAYTIIISGVFISKYTEKKRLEKNNVL